MSDAAMGFDGFPEQALVFYEGLEADNSKAYWTDHKATYDTCVRAPMEALLARLEPEFGPAKLFRPYRDVRFSKDKTPYKTAVAAAVEGGDGTLYIQLSADGLLLAGGYWQTSTDQARRLREAVAEDRSGKALVRILDTMTAAGLAADGDRLKRIPKPWTDEHPRAALLTLKSLTGSVSHEPAQWLQTSEAYDRVADGWRAALPLNAWLHRYVGPPRVEKQR